MGSESGESVEDIVHQPYELGDTVYLPESTTHAWKPVPCWVCYGKRAVTVILGSGESLTVECDYCERCNGMVDDWAPESKVHTLTVDGIRWDGEHWHVHTRRGEHRASAVHSTFESADAVRAAMLAADIKRADQWREDEIRRRRKRVTWGVGYHRSAIARLKKEMAWHEGRLSAAKERQKKERDAGK